MCDLVRIRNMWPKLFLAFSQPPLGIQQLPLIERPDLAGQLVGRLAFADAFVEFALHGLHLGVEVVEEAEGQGFGNHGQLGGAELQLAMVRQNHVQDQSFEARREVGQAVDGALDQRCADVYVAQQDAFDGVIEAGFPGEFVQLADVVQDDAGQQQVTVEERVMRGDAFGQGQQTDNVLQQAAEPGVVKQPGGGGFAVSGGEGGVGEHGAEQPLEIGIGEAVNEAEKVTPELGYVAGGGGQQVGFVHLVRQRNTDLVDLHLQAVVEAGGRAAGLDHVAAVEVFGDARVSRIPDAAFELAGLVAQDEVEVGLVVLGSALLLGQDEEVAVEGPAFVEVGQIGDVDVFHSAEKLNTWERDWGINRLGRQS